LRQKAFDLGSLFPGSNTNLIQARVTDSFLEAIEFEAQGRGYTIPELIREYIAFHLIPGTLRRKFDSGASLETRERFLLEVYRGILAELEETYAQIVKAHEELEAASSKKHLPLDLTKRPLLQVTAPEWGREIADDLFTEKGLGKSKKGGAKKNKKEPKLK
jgi:hypothetical protein